ncbi:hypothetical protein EDC04DRAFT_2612093 [Pisolithus marmoratus]|nr:hypothetical protein EDC04DRAFT_2612093 [Pisolithus marmoratus]
MARTKQTARKVTSGSAPRVNLQVLQKKKAKTKLASKKPSPKTPANTNSFCVMCRDGGDMWLKGDDINFMCVTCHWQKTKNDPKPYILPFNLATPQSMEVYEKAASDLADTLSPYSRVVLFITTHSDEDRGDPFSGFRDGNPVASKVLHSPQGIVKGADMVFYVCGSMVTQEQSFNELPQSPTSTASLITHSFKALMCQLLHSLPRHSNIVLIAWEEKDLVVKKLIWTDKHIGPWGNHLPVQCPQCGTIQKWVIGSAGKTLSSECKYADCGKNMGLDCKSLPPKTWSFSMPKGATQLQQGKKRGIFLATSHIINIMTCTFYKYQSNKM